MIKVVTNLHEYYRDIANSSLKSSGELLFGAYKENGVYITQVAIQIKGKGVWHEQSWF